ncbi:MAG: anti-sigma factor domain-containing protein [Luteimonas sp.]
MNTTADRFDEDSGALPPSDEVRAGEYVLGVLDAQERRQVQARIQDDAAFAELVDAWEQRLSPWLLRYDPLFPSTHVWPRIRTQLGWPAVAGARTGVWNSVGFWRAATALAAAASIAAIAIAVRTPATYPTPTPVVVQPAPTEEQAARPVTVLARDDGATGWIASIDLADGKVFMVPVPTPADAGGRVNELWVIPAGQAPISLGFVSNEKAHSIAVPAAIRGALAVGATLAVTLEPPTGMPHAAPSGPIVAKGGILQI